MVMWLVRHAWLALPLAGMVAACVTIPDEPRNLAPDSGGGSSGSAGNGGSAGGSGSAGDGGIPIPDSGVCPSGFKPCAEQCVPTSDPAYGCTASGCDPCATGTRVVATACEAEKCVVQSCQAGFGDCNGTLDDGCEHDTSSDPENCGACGWSCGGPSCTLGLCAAEEIVKGLQAARQVLVDDDSIYVSQSAAEGVVVRAKDGSPKTGPSVGYAQGIAQDATYVYFSLSDGVWRWPKAGGAHEQLFQLSNVEELAVDDSEIFASRWSDTTMTAELLRGSKTTPGSPTSILTQPARVRAMVADGTRLYFTSWDGKLRRYTKASGAVDSSLPNTSGAWGVVVDSTYVYWRGANAVRRALLDGDTETAIFLGQTEPRAIAISDGVLFWTTGSAVVQGDPLAPQTQRVLASLAKESRGIAADDEFVYWATYTLFGDKTGSVFRLRRPPP